METAFEEATVLNGYFGSRNLELFSLRIRIEAHKR
jgi:hypothetical protein